MYDFEKGLYYRVSTFFGFFYFLLGVFVWKFLPFIYSLSPQEQNKYATLFNVMLIITGIAFLVFPFISFILLLNEKSNKNKVQYNINKNNYIWRIICLDLFIISQIFFLFQSIAFISVITLILIYAPVLILVFLPIFIILIVMALPLYILINILKIMIESHSKKESQQQLNTSIYETPSSIPIIERKESKIIIIVPSLILILLLFHFMCSQFVDFLYQYNFIQKNQNQKYKGYFEPEYRIINDLCYQYIVQKYKK